MAGFVEAWGRGFELITEAFKKEGLEIPTIKEEFDGVRVIIKREIFYAIQRGGRIDPKSGKLVKEDDPKGVTKNVTKKLTDRQLLIYEMLPDGDTENVTKNEEITTMLLALKFGRNVRTIKRDMKALQEYGLVEHTGPSNGGYWKRLK